MKSLGARCERGETEPCRKRVGGDLRKAKKFVSFDCARVIL